MTQTALPDITIQIFHFPTLNCFKFMVRCGEKELVEQVTIQGEDSLGALLETLEKVKARALQGVVNAETA